LVVEVIVFGELFEVGEVLGGEDEGLGVDAGFEGVHGRRGLACDRGGAGGFLGVTAVGFYLSESRHSGSGGVGRRKRLPHFEDRVRISGIRR
jgi:hypothetical protein